MSKQTITVFGATGQQGGSVVDAIFADPELKAKWNVRAVTRDTTKDAAKKLAEQGAEVVAGDMNDKASLVKALEGSHTVFAVTDYWASLDADTETKQGVNIADAAKEVGVQHFIWSTLPEIKNATKGALSNVYHFDSKARVDDHIRSIGLPASYFLAGFYMANISGGMMLRKDPSIGGYVIGQPIPESTIMPLIDTRADTGKFVRGIIKNGTPGQRVLGVSTQLSIKEVLDTFKKVFPEAGANAQFVQISKDQYLDGLEGSGMPKYAALELYENMLLISQFGYYLGESIDESVALAGGVEQLTSLEEHLRNAPQFKGLE